MNLHDWVLWQDEALLAVNKPAGLPTLNDGWQPDALYLVKLLNDAFGRLWVVHRLDRDTSGVIVLARSAEAHRRLNTQFEQRAAHKTYYALAAGAPTWDETDVRLPLLPNGDRQHRTVIDHRRGKPAETHLRVLARFAAAALIEARPQTGRTHQIRAHLAALGHPILGDALYLAPVQRGPNPIPPERLAWLAGVIGRVALHAGRLEIVHPFNGAALEIQAPPPEDFESALARLQAG